MRGEDQTSLALFAYVDIDARIPTKHPLRAMRRLTNAALADLDRAFSALYGAYGRPSIPPERLLRATLLQLLYSIRSERQLVERIEFDLRAFSSFNRRSMARFRNLLASALTRPNSARGTSCSSGCVVIEHIAAGRVPH
jgi:transposase